MYTDFVLLDYFLKFELLVHFANLILLNGHILM